MKLLFILLCFSLSACTFYTVTNSSSTDLRIETPDDIKDLKAGECIELTEYFLGLAGDFPFVILGEKNERNPGHYEIKDQESTSEPKKSSEPDNKPYTVSLSEKNTECNKEDKKKNENGDDDKKTNTSSSVTVDNEQTVLCFSGQVACDKGQAMCIKKAGVSQSSPVCVQSQGEGEYSLTNAVIKCPSQTEAENKALCSSGHKVIVATNQAPLCGGGGQVKCNPTNGKVACGSIQQNAPLKAYCVNQQNLVWGAITCSNGGNPYCSSPSP